MNDKAETYKILDSLPTYGPMYVPITENNESYYSEGFPIRFFKSDGTNWVANFKPGMTELKTVITLEDCESLLVVANGTCYLMNSEETSPLKVFGSNFSKLLHTETHQVILQDLTDLTIVEANGKYWNTDRISWDGLREIKYANRIVRGLSYDPMHDADEWIDFSYNLDTKTLTGGSFRRYEYKKPWWKFWN